MMKVIPSFLTSRRGIRGHRIDRRSPACDESERPWLAKNYDVACFSMLSYILEHFCRLFPRNAFPDWPVINRCVFESVRQHNSSYKDYGGVLPTTTAPQGPHLSCTQAGIEKIDRENGEKISEDHVPESYEDCY